MKSNKYVNRYGGSQAVKNASASRAKTVNKSPVRKNDSVKGSGTHSTGNLVHNPFPFGPAMITQDVTLV